MIFFLLVTLLSFSQQNIADPFSNQITDSSQSSHLSDYQSLTQISQVGNWLHIEQEGDSNTIEAEQIGGRHRAKLSQYGDSNIIELIQRDDADYIVRIDQQGNDNVAKIVQKDPINLNLSEGYLAIYQQNGSNIEILKQDHAFIEITQY